MYDLKVDDILYHKTNKIRGVVTSVSEEYIELIFDQVLSRSKKTEFNKESIGKWLFYSKDHADLHTKDIVTLNEYQHIKNLIGETKKPKSEKLTIQEVIEARKISNLVHFTRAENLESILNKGLIPRDILDKDNIRYLHNDPTRLDKKTNCTCFSVEFPNCYLFKKFRERNPSSIWAVILVDSSILLENDRDIYYCYHNAARYDVKEKLSRGNLRSLKDFENLFREVEYYNRGEFSGTNYRKDIFYIKDYLTTSPQAEILVSGVIPSRYINSVIFASQLDLSHFSDVSLSKINDSKNIKNKLKVNHKYFLKREEVNFPERGV